MTKYELSCGCGKTVPVDVGQAGERVTCVCGATIDVPPLRKLRHLPVVAGPQVEQPSTSWNARRGIVAACLIVAGGLALWALWNRWSEPVIEPFDAGARQQMIESGLQTMTPAQTWQLWIDRYRPLAEHGFTEMEHMHAAAVDQQVTERRFLQKTLLVTAGVFAGIAVIAAVWPRAAPERRR